MIHEGATIPEELWKKLYTAEARSRGIGSANPEQWHEDVSCIRSEILRAARVMDAGKPSRRRVGDKVDPDHRP